MVLLKKNIYYKIIFLSLFLLVASKSFAQEKLIPRTIFTLETGYLLSGIKNNGWGLGFSIEQQIINFLSVKGTFSHLTFVTSTENVYCATVGLSLFANLYPFGNGLDKLYFSGGCSTDFLNYFGSGNVPDIPKDTVTSLIPIIGWKQNFPKFDIKSLQIRCLIDFYTGWQFIIQDSHNLPNDLNYTSHGWFFELKIKISIEKKH